VGLQRGPLSLVSTIDALFGRNSNGSGLEIGDYGRRGSAALTTRTFALTSPTSGVRSVGIVRSRNQAREFVFVLFIGEDCSRRSTDNTVYGVHKLFLTFQQLPAVKFLFLTRHARPAKRDCIPPV
jgi:hypothetical protein